MLLKKKVEDEKSRVSKWCNSRSSEGKLQYSNLFQFDRIAEDIEMLSSTDCDIKKGWKTLRISQKELRLRWQC